VNLKLLQLVSPSLPVGAYSYSQGLEAAIEAGFVHDAASAREWIAGVLELSLGSFEAPVLQRLAEAWGRDDAGAARHWNGTFVASRESAELRAETLQMGYSLRRLLNDLGLDTAPLDSCDELAYPCAFAFAVARWNVDASEAMAGYLFAWIENQVLAAVKTVPLGQTEGQRMLLALAERIPGIVAIARGLDDESLSNGAPGLALVSSRHETQYSRLFRS
jgi:urease accessory protein